VSYVTILCIGYLGVSASVTNAQNRPRLIGGGFYQIKMPIVSAPMDSGGNLEISVVGKLPISGAVEVRVLDGAEVSVDVSSTFRADDNEQASEMMTTSGARLLPSDNGLHLKIRIDPSVWTLFEGEKPSLDLTVTVPLRTSIEIDAPYLRVSSKGAIAGLLINETYEPVDIRGARGVIRVESRSGSIRLSDLIGGFDIRTSNARITLTDIQVTEVSANRARTEDGRLDIRRYRGPLRARTARADIWGVDIQLTGNRNWIENSGGLIDVIFSEFPPNTRVDVRNSYEDIQLKFERDLSAVFSLRTKDGKAIEIENLPHRILDVGENKIEAECGDGESLVAVRAKYGGSILISGKK
jgi:hypothetical protein